MAPSVVGTLYQTMIFRAPDASLLITPLTPNAHLPMDMLTFRWTCSPSAGYAQVQLETSTSRLIRQLSGILRHTSGILRGNSGIPHVVTGTVYNRPKTMCFVTLERVKLNMFSSGLSQGPSLGRAGDHRQPEQKYVLCKIDLKQCVFDTLERVKLNMSRSGLSQAPSLGQAGDYQQPEKKVLS